ncbi:MAG TPA: hypothetical protein VIC32_02260 [Terriglobales bacterium]|jgi:hypothetical protein
MVTSSLQRRLLRELAYIIVFGSPLVLFFLIAMPRSNAARLTKSLESVAVNRTKFNDVERLATRFNGYAACVGDNCLFQFQNSWLHRLHLAPMTEFSVMVQRVGHASDPGGGEVGAIDMAMLISGDGQARSGEGAIASAIVFDRGEIGPSGPYTASINIGLDGRPDRTVVTLSPGATARQRTRARAFDLRCLTRIGGCKDSHQILPEVWNGARRIESAKSLIGAGPSAAIAARPAFAKRRFGGPIAPNWRFAVALIWSSPHVWGNGFSPTAG